MNELQLAIADAQGPATGISDGWLIHHDDQHDSTLLAIWLQYGIINDHQPSITDS